MAAKLEIEFRDGETATWEGWHAQLIWPIVKLIMWYRVIIYGDRLTIKRRKK